MEEVSSMTLSEECSALLRNKLPKKEKDSGGFIVPCTIKGLVDEKALANLEASINLMPYKIFQKLGLGEPKPTNMTLQLADRSTRRLRGIIEDVLVKVDKFIFLVDFIILDVDDKVEVTLILGWPFLATSKALIDVKDAECHFELAMKKPPSDFVTP
ncbi:uncharacterized protein LOC120277734 [Dioscorea cayenensis subsp. rotundata]|uniref:Uncharacterized protein LOC120277734 n=1 Tax=Dioscorea cayennensis subsp. rotundata TaxID=55577 RepID=A0AB40CPM6_DIOCR|nr:uncharacterized protein LOC120277734 [Dioscorea cayenensis subsp. rotundata]